MHICMKTTLNIDDDLMRTVKKRAAEKGTTVSATIETALRELLRQEEKPERPFRLRWQTVRGKLQAGVDLTDRDALLERMEGRS